MHYIKPMDFLNEEDKAALVDRVIIPYIRPCISYACHAMLPYIAMYTLVLVALILIPLFFMVRGNLSATQLYFKPTVE